MPPTVVSRRRDPADGVTSMRSALARSEGGRVVTEVGKPRVATAMTFGLSASRSMEIGQTFPARTNGSVTCAAKVVTA